MNGERTCIGCREKGTKADFLRISKSPDGIISLDSKGKGPGRGAYVCSTQCLSKAVENGSLARALRCKVPADVCESLIRSAHEGAALKIAKGSKE